MVALVLLGIAAFIAVFVLSIFFDGVKASSLAVLSAAKVVLSFFVTGFDMQLLIYAILGEAVLLILLGTECFNSDTEGTWIPRNDGKGWKEDINHPFQALIGTILGSAIIVGVSCLIAYFSDFFYLLSILSGIELILSVASVIRVIRNR